MKPVFRNVTASIPAAWRTRVAAEVAGALDGFGVRRDLQVAVTGGTPRRYRVAARDALVAECPFATELYRSESLRALIGNVAGERVVPVPYAPEELIATRLERAGDTHGWHWDDYTYALVWVLAAPSPAEGGVLEYIPGVPWHKDAPGVDAILAEREAVRAPLAGGSVYLLRTDTTLHRVSPLLAAGRRDALCFSYAAVSSLGRTITHETLEAILA